MPSFAFTHEVAAPAPTAKPTESPAPEFPRERLEAASRLGQWEIPADLKWDGQRWQGESGSVEIGADGQLKVERLMPSNQQINRTTVFSDGQQREIVDLYQTDKDYSERNTNLRGRQITDIQDEKNRTSTQVMWEDGKWPANAQRPTELSGRPPALGSMTTEVTRDGQTRTYRVERDSSGRHELRAQDDKGFLEAKERWDSDGLHASFTVGADGHNYQEQTLPDQRNRDFDRSGRTEIPQGDGWKGELQHGDTRLVEEATNRVREGVKARKGDDAARPILDLAAANIPSRRQFGDNYSNDTTELDRAVDRAQAATKDVASLAEKGAVPLRDEDVARLGELYTDKLGEGLRSAEVGDPLKPLAELYQARSILSDKKNPHYSADKAKEAESRIEEFYKNPPVEAKKALEDIRADAQFAVFGRDLPELAKSQAAYMDSPEFSQRLLEMPPEQATETYQREFAKLYAVDPEKAGHAAEAQMKRATAAVNATLSPGEKELNPLDLAAFVAERTNDGLTILGKEAGLVRALGPIAGLLGGLSGGAGAFKAFQEGDTVGGIASSVGAAAGLTSFAAGLVALSPAAGPGAPLVAAVAGLVGVGAMICDKIFGESDEETRTRKEGDLLKSLGLS